MRKTIDVIRDNIARSIEILDEKSKMSYEISEELTNFVKTFYKIGDNEKDILEMRDPSVVVDLILNRRYSKLASIFTKFRMIENVRENETNRLLENFLVYISYLEEIIQQKKDISSSDFESIKKRSENIVETVKEKFLEAGIPGFVKGGYKKTEKKR